MTCTHCNIWRPKTGFNVIVAVSRDGRTIQNLHYCLADDFCRLESVGVVSRLKEVDYIISQSHPLSLEQETELLRRLLRVETGLECNTCHHDLAYHTLTTVRSINGCDKQVTSSTKCTCLIFVPHKKG